MTHTSEMCEKPSDLPDLAVTREALLSEGWTERQVNAAISYAMKWAQSNARIGAKGDPDLDRLLLGNYMENALDQARQWLVQSRNWAISQAQDNP